jgi:hypothetical protein
MARNQSGFSHDLDGVTATAAEINGVCDKNVQALAAAGAITADGTINRCTISGGAYAATLAVPSGQAIGQFLCIEYAGGDTDAVTLANTNMISGSAGTTYTLNADGEGLLLFGAATKWVVVKEFGGITIA